MGGPQRRGNGGKPGKMESVFSAHIKFLSWRPMRGRDGHTTRVSVFGEGDEKLERRGSHQPRLPQRVRLREELDQKVRLVSSFGMMGQS